MAFPFPLGEGQGADGALRWLKSASGLFETTDDRRRAPCTDAKSAGPALPQREREQCVVAFSPCFTPQRESSIDGRNRRKGVSLLNPLSTIPVKRAVDIAVSA